MENLKVLHFFKTSLLDSHGGVEKFIDTLCKDTYDLGVKNIFFTLRKKYNNKEVKFKKYSIINAKEDFYFFSTGFSISALFEFKKLSKNADLIHYHFPNPFADILHFISGNKKPFLITYHSDIIKQRYLLFIYKFLMNKFLIKSNKIVVTSQNYFKSSIYLNRYKNKVRVIPIGIDLNTYPKINKKIIDNYKKQFKEPFFLFVGALRYYKGLEFALKAIKNTNFKFVIAGDGDNKSKLVKLANNLKLDNVNFLGEISEEEKVCLLKLCKCFLFPSNKRSEAFGIALLEAAAFGKPMISCDIGTGTSFVNIHNETGIVIKPNSALEIRKAMDFIISNPDISKSMGKNSKKRYLNLFTADKQAKNYLEIYKEILYS